MSPNDQSSKNEFDLGLTRHWIAKCLVMGRKIEYIRGSLLEKGLPISVVDAEIKLAQDSPYIKGGRTVYKRDIEGLELEARRKQSVSNQRNRMPLKTQKSCSHLEAGDFIPNFIANGRNGALDIQSKAHSQFILLLTDRTSATLETESATTAKKLNIPLYIISKDKESATKANHIFFEPNLKYFFADETDKHDFIVLVSKNLKINTIFRTRDPQGTLIDIINQIASNRPIHHNSAAPILIVPDVISKDLCDRLIDYAEINGDHGHTASRPNKSRFHISPNKSLLSELDDKLSRSLLPEIEKTFYSKITHREAYKICSYDAEKQGRFTLHRDTIDPYRHRRYGFSLALNDNFSGGGINFPEYNDNIVSAGIGSAIVFPGSLFHQISTIQTGIRWALISFLFSQDEARPNKDEANEFTFQYNTNKLTLKTILPSKHCH
jgi:hypothetical protein